MTKKCSPLHEALVQEYSYEHNREELYPEVKAASFNRKKLKRAQFRIKMYVIIDRTFCVTALARWWS